MKESSICGSKIVKYVYVIGDTTYIEGKTRDEADARFDQWVRKNTNYADSMQYIKHRGYFYYVEVENGNKYTWNGQHLYLLNDALACVTEIPYYVVSKNTLPNMKLVREALSQYFKAIDMPPKVTISRNEADYRVDIYAIQSQLPIATIFYRFDPSLSEKEQTVTCTATKGNVSNEYAYAVGIETLRLLRKLQSLGDIGYLEASPDCLDSLSISVTYYDEVVICM